MPSSNFERLMGGMLVMSQGAATFALGEAGVGPSLVRVVAAVAFFSAGTAVLARSEAARGGAAGAVVAAVGWMAYAVYVGGADAAMETPFLAVAGAALAYHSSMVAEQKE